MKAVDNLDVRGLALDRMCEVKRRALEAQGYVVCGYVLRGTGERANGDHAVLDGPRCVWQSVKENVAAAEWPESLTPSRLQEIVAGCAVGENRFLGTVDTLSRRELRALCVLALASHADLIGVEGNAHIPIDCSSQHHV